MKDSEFESIRLLITESNNGNDAAREELFAQIQSYVELMASRHMDASIKQKVAHSDIVQQTLFNAAKNFGQFRGKTSAEFRAWLKSILVNEVSNARREFRTAKRDISKEEAIDLQNLKIRNLNHPADDQLTPSSQALAAEQVDNFYELLTQLPEHYAQVIQLRSIEQLPFKEVADRMGKSYDAISQLWYRAVEKFEKLLEESEAFKSRADNKDA